MKESQKREARRIKTEEALIKERKKARELDPTLLEEKFERKYNRLAKEGETLQRKLEDAKNSGNTDLVQRLEGEVENFSEKFRTFQEEHTNFLSNRSELESAHEEQQETVESAHAEHRIRSEFYGNESDENLKRRIKYFRNKIVDEETGKLLPEESLTTDEQREALNEVKFALGEANARHEENTKELKGHLKKSKIKKGGVAKKLSGQSHHESKLVDLKPILEEYYEAKKVYDEALLEQKKKHGALGQGFANIMHRLGMTRREKTFSDETRAAKTKHEEIFAQRFEEAREKLLASVRERLATRGSSLIDTYEGTSKAVTAEEIVERYDSIMVINHMMNRELQSVSAHENQIFKSKFEKGLTAAGGYIKRIMPKNKVARFLITGAIFGAAGGALTSVMAAGTYFTSRLIRASLSGVASKSVVKGIDASMTSIQRRFFGKYGTMAELSRAYQQGKISITDYLARRKKMEQAENAKLALQKGAALAAGFLTSIKTSGFIHEEVSGAIDSSEKFIHEQSQHLMHNIQEKVVHENPLALHYPAQDIVSPEVPETPVDSTTVDINTPEDTVSVEPVSPVVDTDTSHVIDQPDANEIDQPDTTEIADNSDTVETPDAGDASPEDTVTTTDLTPEDVRGGTETEKIFEITVKKGHGAISMFRDLQHHLQVAHPDYDPATEPDGELKDLMTMDPHQLAEKYNFYNPQDDAESAFVEQKAQLIYNEETGTLLYARPHGANILLEDGDTDTPMGQFEGKFMDSGHHTTGTIEHHDGGTQPHESLSTNDSHTQSQVDYLENREAGPVAQHFYDQGQTETHETPTITPNGTEHTQGAPSSAENAGGSGAAGKTTPDNVFSDGTTGELQVDTTGYDGDAIIMAEKYASALPLEDQEAFLRTFNKDITKMFGIDVDGNPVQDPFGSTSLWDTFKGRSMGVVVANISDTIQKSGVDGLSAIEQQIGDYVTNEPAATLFNTIGTETTVEDFIARVVVAKIQP